MKYKKSIIIIMLAIFLVSIAAVSASDVNEASIASGDDSQIELSQSGEVETDNLQTGEEQIVTQTDNDENLSASDELDVLGADEATYSNLSDEIAVGGNVELHHNYYYYSGGSFIYISGNNRIIDGKGAVIDMTGSSDRAFVVTDYNVTIKNLTIKNAKYSGFGGAIHFEKSGTVTNCTFIGNTASGGGGAVYFPPFAAGEIINCNFIGNNAASGYGGAILFDHKKGTITNCTFINNTASSDGGAVYFNGNGEVTNCNFTGNNATTGSAIYINSYSTITVSNSRFLNNKANAETLEVTKNDNNITITFTGNDNLLNAINSGYGSEVTFTNVTYWSANGIATTGSSAIKPTRSNREAGQNITLEIYDSLDSLVDNVTLTTDYNGQVSYDFTKLSDGKYTYKVYHPDDSYYTFIEKNDTFTVGTGDFNLLQNYINKADANSVLTLNRSYTFTIGLDENLTDGIVIDKPITINGNGHTINAMQKARIFLVSADNVVLNNITFTNATASGNGGAVTMLSGNLTNCNFINNTAHYAGAIGMGSGNVINCNFTNNKATSGSGGAIIFGGTGNVTNCNFVDNKATSYGGGAIYFSSSGTVENCNFTDNQASGDGGAVYFWDEGTVTNCNFTGNNATWSGGAVYFNSNGNVTNCNFTNNKASGDGGAIDFEGTCTVTNCNFIGNNATYYGGAIYFSSSGTTHEVRNCNFTGNNATWSGGAVYFNSNGNVTNCNFVNNTANSQYYGGGAVYFYANGTVTNCNFTNNTASNSGGAVYFYKNSECTVTNCNFTNNSARYGGAINMGSGSVTNCNFTDNKATGDDGCGGAVYFNKNVEGNVTNCSFTNNFATDSGGGVYFGEGSNGRTINCNFTDNEAKYGGAFRFNGEGTVTNCNFTNNTSYFGLILFAGAGNVTNCNFTDNHAERNGGAVYFVGSGNVTNCNFTNNKATEEYNSYGGAVYFYSSGTVENCNFTNNSASYGGAVYFYSSGTVENCNFTNNKATNGGAINMGSGSVTNCNFTNNKATNGGAIWFISNGNVTNCNFTDNNATTGSAIYFWSTSATKTVSNSCFLNNRANAETLEVIKNDNNITITFTGNDNLLNAIYSNGDVTFTNVTYWGANGIANTDSSTPVRFNKESGQNITVSVVVNDKIVLNKVITTDENGTIVLDISAGENYYISARHDTDSYYTEAEKTISTMNFNVNVTSQTTNNKTVNITAKSNIPNEVIDGKLLFIVPNSNPINATYAGNGTWWALHTFADYTTYQVNATYEGLDNVTVNNGTISISKTPTNITVENATVDLFIYDSVVTGARLTPADAGNLTFTSSNSSIAKVEKGNIIAVGEGTANITVSFAGSDDYAAAENKTITVNVIKYESKVTISPINDTVYPNNVTIKYSIENKTNVTVTIDGVSSDKIIITNDTITVIALDAGKYTITILNNESDLYYKSSDTKSFTVNKLATSISAADISTTYNINKNLVVTLKDSTGKALSGVKVTVDLNGAKTYTTDSNGQVKVATKGLAPKTYTVKIAFNGNTNYDKSVEEVKVTVKKATPKLTAKAKTFKATTKTKKYTITLKDNTGKAIKKAKVTLKVNGKTYKATTNSKGKATFKITKLNKKGTYKATVTYEANKYYNKATKKVKITVKGKKSTFKTVSKGSKDTKTVKKIQRALKDNGYYVTYQGHYLKIDGKYNSCTVRSVKEFQNDKGLKVTGKVDQKTAKKLGII